MYGVTSHVMGKWLIAIALRTIDKRPSKEAFAGGFVEQAPTGRGNGGYFWVWHTERTIAALEEAGYRRSSQEPAKSPAPNLPINRIFPPFSLHRSSVNGYEVLGGDGAVAVWAMGENNARIVAEALNRYFDGGQKN
jgi:hypothetical protein